MRKRTKKMLLAILALLIAVSVAACRSETSDEEIRVNIQLELEEDIGLLLTEYTANGKQGMSGSSVADKSMIKRNSMEFWTFEKWMLEDDLADTVELRLKFIVVTEYFEPDYDFDYPEEYTIPMDAISFTANFGETYHVTIQGGKTSGYQAVFDGQ